MDKVNTRQRKFAKRNRTKYVIYQDTPEGEVLKNENPMNRTQAYNACKKYANEYKHKNNRYKVIAHSSSFLVMDRNEVVTEFYMKEVSYAA